MMKLHWNKGLFTCTYRLMSGNKQVGKIKENQWSQSAIGEIEGRRVAFKMKQRLVPYTEIIDLDTRKMIGKIKFGCWWSKATIDYQGQKLQWRYNNWFSTKWSITDNQGNKTEYNGYSTKGNVESAVHDSLIMLSGLFIGNYYWQMLAIYSSIVIFPILFLLS